MRGRSKGNKVIDIRLKEEKFYFPGEVIKGDVIVHPKSATKTNHIVVRFTGEIFLSVKDKETINLFQNTKILPVSKIEGSKTHVLEPRQHKFSFEFTVPNDLNLPSSMEFGKRKARIRYWITAIHDRPMMPESLCAKAEYIVPILEFVDITTPVYAKPQEKAIDLVLPHAKYNQKCQLSLSIPRFGYTRGDIVPLRIVVNHFEPFTREQALEVELVRTVEIRTCRNTVFKEHILRSTKHDVKILGPYNFSISINCQLLIPTSTPPTIRYKDKMLHIHYKARVRLNLTGKPSTAAQQSWLEMPIIVGTWPRASVPIDDDDDDEISERMGVMMLSDDMDSDTEDNDSFYEGKRGSEDRLALQIKRLSVASSSSTTFTLRNAKSSTAVGRSDSTASRSSNKSHGSMSSWRSSQSWGENNAPLSRNASLATTVSAPDYQKQSTTASYRTSIVGQPSLPPPGMYGGGNINLNRSSSTPDLLAQPVNHPPPSSNNGFKGYPRSTLGGPLIAPLTPHHEPGAVDPYASNVAMRNRPVNAIHTVNPPIYHPTTPAPMGNQVTAPTPNRHSRMRSDDYRYSHLQPIPPSSPPVMRSPISPQSPVSGSTQLNVPTHILQPMPSASKSYTTMYDRHRSTSEYSMRDAARPRRPSSGASFGSKPPHRNYNYSYYDDMSDSDQGMGNPTSPTPSDSSDDDDDDDNDLFRIIEKKKKQAEREARQRQRMVYTVAE
ncbi:uncharacterized protein BYT42DRAFT_578678 [Radiomyces spectabilis]|uniref:uncharacterized protein n=1 Tax=Radiomyces spectabilis TaxID=64574 RepID=UPI0022212AAE|nr:uncharacterized protein BYT42DRAFT_578678 [Radiomyces spectabilis]KAI8372945.1 hypothetical protein BYT42DRAFT_578678 [Radiomyces spectabilis]